jgi:hypothetical protein
MDWNTADPYLWSPALAKQAAVMKMNPNMAASTSEQKSFTPISLGGGGVKGKASISQQQQFNLLSPSQFPPLGATATTNHSSVKQPPPPPPPESPTPSSSTLNTNTTLTKQQKKRKSTQMFASVGLDESEEERRQKEKRARRFEREIGIEKLREQGAIQDEEDEVHAPVGDYGGSGLAARLGMRTGRSGRGSRAGYSMGGLEQEEPEADPVSRRACYTCLDRLTRLNVRHTECYKLGQIYHQRNQYTNREKLSPSNQCKPYSFANTVILEIDSRF